MYDLETSLNDLPVEGLVMVIEALDILPDSGAGRARFRMMVMVTDSWLSGGTGGPEHDHAEALYLAPLCEKLGVDVRTWRSWQRGNQAADVDLRDSVRQTIAAYVRDLSS